LGDRTLKYSSSQPGFAAHALHLLGDIAPHSERFDAEGGEAHYRKALTRAGPNAGARARSKPARLGMLRSGRRWKLR
jgi:hypothetical protein